MYRNIKECKTCTKRFYQRIIWNLIGFLFILYRSSGSNKWEVFILTTYMCCVDQQSIRRMREGGVIWEDCVSSVEKVAKGERVKRMHAKITRKNMCVECTKNPYHILNKTVYELTTFREITKSVCVCVWVIWSALQCGNIVAAVASMLAYVQIGSPNAVYFSLFRIQWYIWSR